MNTDKPRIALSIAGSDSGGGAGIQADQRVFQAHGWFCATAITAITAQNSAQVVRVHPVGPDLLSEQLQAILDDFHVGVVKIGMLSTAENAAVVAHFLPAFQAPVVFDPVLRASAGPTLSVSDGFERLFPLCTLITPNRREAEILSGGAPEAWAARQPCAVLITGGDEPGDSVVDRLFFSAEVRDFVGRRIPGPPVHGTGCTLASAIAAQLGRGTGLTAAVEAGIQFTRNAIANAVSLGAGARVLVGN